MKKLRRMVRRWRLGKQWKHLDTCHKKFSMQRLDNAHLVLWDGEEITRIRSVLPLKKQKKGPCFLVASGPSLNSIDLNRLGMWDSISLNGAIVKFLQHGMVPAHVIIVDRRIFENCFNFVKDSIESGANCFFSYVGISHICEREPALLANENIYLVESIHRKYDQPLLESTTFHDRHSSNNNIYMSSEYPDSTGVIGFSCDAGLGFFTGRTVPVWGIQLGHWLGYDSLFFLGMDLGATGKAHFYAQNSNGLPDFLKYYEPEIRVSFELAQHAADHNDFRLFNLSEQSTLSHSIIPKISYDNALDMVHGKVN